MLILAYAEGPGGPVNTIIMTQSYYQVILDVFVEGQKLGMYGVLGFLIGFTGAIILCLGNQIIRKFMTKE